jgi:hypothetical protein
MMNNISMVSGQPSAGDAMSNGNNYNLSFPTLPVLKTSQTIGTAQLKKRSNFKSSTVNEVIYHAILIVINKY